MHKGKPHDISFKGWKSGDKSLTDAPISKTQKRQDWLTKVTEKSPLIDWMYHSPEESFDKTFGGAAIGYRNKGTGNQEWLRSIDVKELWKEAGKPRVKTHNMQGKMKRGAFFKPRGYKWDYGRKNPKTLFDKVFGSDKIFVPKTFGEGGDLGSGISELAHSMRFKDPERYSQYDTRDEIMMGKGNEHAGGFDATLYRKKHTDEYQTHSVVEPMLRQWLSEKHGKTENEFMELMDNGSN
jgi:hypothetical protein